MSFVIVVPTYNERENIDILLDAILREVPEAHLLIVDDQSTDGTGEAAEAWARRQPEQVSVLHRMGKPGLGAAYVAGYRYAMEHWPDAEFLVQMDADLSHEPASLRPLLDAASDADVVLGSRYVAGGRIMNWSRRRRLLSRLGVQYARLLTGLPVKDCTGGFKCYRAEVLRAIDLPSVRSNGYCFQIETTFRAWRMGFRIKEIPVVFRERERGESKLTLGIALEALRVVTRLGWDRLRRKGPQPTSAGVRD